MEKAIVTIGVITYNASKYVLETLESIKAQTYQPLKLIISDDCSTDNTLELCRKWVEQNKSRFISTHIIVPEHNTGVTANFNRVEDACDTEWYKPIAGDDILLPECIADNMGYVQEHPDAIFVFSHMKSFGTTLDRCKHFDEVVYKYDLFDWAIEEQYNYLYNVRNCIPAPTVFINVLKKREQGLRYDERIPQQEDVPMWLNALMKKIQLHYYNKMTVGYRIHENSLSSASIISPISHESSALVWYYYHFIDEYKRNPEMAIKHAVEREMDCYKRYYNTYFDFINCPDYKIGHFLLTPLRFIKKIIDVRKDKLKHKGRHKTIVH